MNICQIVYLSRATAHVDRTELASITSESAERNAKSFVTGALLFCNGYFLQILEGHPATLDVLLEKIARDVRHTDVQIISRTKQKVCLFPDWTMACIHESAMTPTQLQEATKAIQLLIDTGNSGSLEADAVALLVELRSAISEESKAILDRAA